MAASCSAYHTGLLVLRPGGSTWLRRPIGNAATRTYRLVASASPATSRVTACTDALAGLRWVVSRRRVVPPYLLRLLQMIDGVESERDRG